MIGWSTKKHCRNDSPDRPGIDTQQEQAGPSNAEGTAGKPAGTFGARLYLKVARDMVDLMTEHGPEILGFDSLPAMPDSIVGETDMNIVAT